MLIPRTMPGVLTEYKDQQQLICFRYYRCVALEPVRVACMSCMHLILRKCMESVHPVYVAFLLRV